MRSSLLKQCRACCCMISGCFLARFVMPPVALQVTVKRNVMQAGKHELYEACMRRSMSQTMCMPLQSKVILWQDADLPTYVVICMHTLLGGGGGSGGGVSLSLCLRVHACTCSASANPGIVFHHLHVRLARVVTCLSRSEAKRFMGQEAVCKHKALLKHPLVPHD